MDKTPDNQRPVRILAATNASYATPLCVMLVSVACNLGKNRRLEIYIIDSGISARDRENIAASLRANRRGFREEDVHWLALDLTPIRDMVVDDHLSVETYSRLLAPDLLPADCDRILYLDCDLVAIKDVAEIYDAITDQKIVLAVQDIGIPFVDDPGGVFNYIELGISPDRPYFNGGVLGINMRRWREKEISKRILEYLRRYKDQIHYHDQGGMNAILHDEWGQLDLIWNQCTYPILHPEIWARAGYKRADWARVRDHAAIIHYSGSEKPWNIRRINKPRGIFFFRYFNKTAYRGTIKEPCPETIFGYRIYFFLWRMVRKIVYALRGLPP